jgi:hypothetical protein
MIEFLVLAALSGAVISALSASVLHRFCPDTPAQRLIWLSATIAPILAGLVFFQAAMLAASDMRTEARAWAFIAVPFQILLGLLVMGLSLTAGYFVSRFVITSLRRS